ncbi:MAG TPA: phosphoribosyltransferase [Candidatus Bilamarchaeaceae archaeon]|nr:phosphoribosyltransferase [Candidatus Bilamarchaeaceae archaeon]
MEFLKVSWIEVANMCESLIKKMDFKPDILVGISRGGLIPVRIFSDLLDNHNVTIIKIEFYKTINQTSGFPKITQPLAVDVKGKKVLIVDDVSDTGRSLAVAKDHIQRSGAKEIKVATLHYKPHSTFKPDYFVGQTSAWIVYPWEVHETERELKKKS